MMGSVIPLGDGATGKSVITQLLINENLTEDERNSILKESRKSFNIEMEFKKGEAMIDGKDIVTSEQFYVFPGQRQKISEIAPTFDEILAIFEFMPAIKNVSVLLLVYDITRLESLKSLETWTNVALQREWITDKTLTVLVSNKSDLQQPNLDFVEKVREGVSKLIGSYEQHKAAEQVRTITTSGLTGEGIQDLKSMISNWIASQGKHLT